MTSGFKPFTDQNFVLSDQDGVLVGHNVLSREKKLFSTLPLIFTHVWSTIEKIGSNDTAGTERWVLKQALNLYKKVLKQANSPCQVGLVVTPRWES